MKLAECYAHIEESISYTMLYAPSYPVEDGATLDSERFELRLLLINLRAMLASGRQRLLVSQAIESVEEAFEEYDAGRYGGRHLRDAVTQIEMTRGPNEVQKRYSIEAQRALKQVKGNAG